MSKTFDFDPECSVSVLNSRTMQKLYYVLKKHIAKVQTCHLNKFTLMQFKIQYKNLTENFFIIHDTINRFLGLIC